MRTVRVDLADRGYDVVVGAGAVGSLPDLLPASARRAAVVTQEGIDFAVDPGRPATTSVIGPGETAKTIAVRVKGDRTVEVNETFFVNLTYTGTAVTLFDRQGLGTIVNDD